MKFRSLLRDDNKQLQLEKQGAVVIPFLIQDNIFWLIQKKNELSSRPDTADTAFILHETLNEKLQSKIEYRCINCSPFQIFFSDLLSKIKIPSTFLVNDSITNEERSSSLHLIAPVIKAEDTPITFKYLAGSHLLTVPHRGKDIPSYYEGKNKFITSNFSSLKVKSGEAFLFFGNMPYTIEPASEPKSTLLLEISVLPYEARPTIYKLNKDGEDLSLSRYETEIESYIQYQSGIEDAIGKMKALRNIPFVPSYLSDKEKEGLALKRSVKSLILNNRLFIKIFSR